MILVFFGAPGSGKGTQAQSLAKKLDFEYIATGNLLRSEIAAGTALGDKLKTFIDVGGFPTDDVIMDVFRGAFAKSSGKNIILDGVPRTLNQAHLIDGMFDQLGIKVSSVIEFKLDDGILVERILGRFSCVACGATYHKKFNPPKVDGVCDFCDGKEFIVRPDDQEDVLKKRLELYYLETLPILEYYSSKGVVTSIDASLSPDKVGEEIMTIIKKADKGE